MPEPCVFLTMFVALALVDGSLVWLLVRTGGSVRPLSVSDLDAVEAPPVRPLKPGGAHAVSLLETVGAGAELERAIAAMAWLLDKPRCVADAAVEYRGPERTLAAYERGEGALCGELAATFRHVLATLGFASRLVQVQRNLFDRGDIHLLVEARIDGRWVLLDPTFNLLFRDPDGNPLGAQGVRERVFKQGHGAVFPEFLGEVSYPPRAEAYYLYPLGLFNHVFVRLPTTHALGRLPLLRQLWGPR
ncbi:MAG: transglutaminase-like domain-containing protein, partial [Gammaproteobacteria bacterium]